MSSALVDRGRTSLLRWYRRPAGRAGCSFRAALMLGVAGTSELRRVRRGDHVVVVHQPGKVGSSAIIASLRPALDGHGYRTYHTHLLNRASRATLWAARGRQRWSPKRTWAESAIISRALQRYRGDVTVISVVRQPSARLSSSVLETPEWYIDGAPTAEELERLPASELRRAVEECARRDHVLDWYNTELREYWGFSLDGAADQLRRGETYSESRGNRRLLIVRFDELADAFGAITEELFGQRFELPVVNTTAQKLVPPDLIRRLEALAHEYFRDTECRASTDLPFEVYRRADIGGPEGERR